MQSLPFIDSISALLTLSIGLSVPFRLRRHPISLVFFLFTLGVAGLFATGSLVGVFPAGHLWPVRALISACTGWLGLRFFFVLIHGERPFLQWKTPLLVTIAWLLAMLMALTMQPTVPPWQGRFLEGLLPALSLFWVVGELLAVRRKTTQRGQLGRIHLLFWVTLLLAAFFTGLRLLPGGGVTVHVTGNAVVLLYLYFLSQTLSQQRLLDLDEVLTRVGVLTGLVTVISGIYLLLLSWIPDPRQELFSMIIISASVIVVLFMDPLTDFAERWFFRLLFQRRKALEQHLRQMVQSLDVLPASEHELADRVMEQFMESHRVFSSCLYVQDPHLPQVVRLGAIGRDFPLHVPLSHWEGLWERLQVGSPVSRQDVELECDRLRKGWLVPNTTYTAHTLLAALDELEADACFPVFAHDRLHGFFSVGDPTRRSPWAKSELEGFWLLARKMGSVFTSLKSLESIRRQEHLASLGQLAAGLAHEIRNPLGAIWGAVQVLESPQANALSGEERSAFFQIVAQEVNRLNRVVLDFLEYARPAPNNADTLDLVETCRQLKPLLAKTADPVPLDLQVDAAGPLTIGMDEDKLRQILLNLVLNAREAVLPDTSKPVVLHLFERKDSRPRVAVLEVRDFGHGISPDHLSRVMEPFFTTREKGTGLGLPICSRLMEAAGGRLVIGSSPKGTVCTLDWPLCGL